MPEQEISEKIFLETLEETRRRLLKTDLKNIKSGEEFESLTYDTISAVCKDRGITNFGRTSKHSFPDIFVGPFGIEAKFTEGDKWITTGNSITEATRKSGLKKIYVFFCKQGKNGVPDIRFRPYDECVFDIAVTHSPRYKLNLELGENDNIFKKMGMDYDTFCKNSPIKVVKDYYRKNLKKGEELWWLDNETAPIIRNFSALDIDTKKRFQIEVMVLYPEVFSNSRIKYRRPALYILTKYQAQGSSFRDLFTSGGRMPLTLSKEKTIRISKILYHLHNNAKAIKKILTEIDVDELASAWGIKISDSKDVEKIFLSLVDKHGGLAAGTASLIYEAGLRA